MTQTEAQSFYDFPALYAALLPVEDQHWECIANLLDNFGLAPRSVFDPACGPGGWLAAFQRRMGCQIAGNDLRGPMIDLARQQMPRGEWVRGDMTDLRLESGPFDLAVNLSSSLGHLPDDQAVTRHLHSVSSLLCQGGVYLLEVTSPLYSRQRPQHLWTSNKTSVGSGHARIIYRSNWVDCAARQEQICLELTTWNLPQAPRTLTETYVLRTFPEELLRQMAQQAGLRTLGALRMPLDNDDLIFVLSKDPQRSP